jgi:hypothetical protein
MRTHFLAVGLVVTLLAGGRVLAAGSRCDSRVSKAVGKMAACQCRVMAKAQMKGSGPNSGKLAACGRKFSTACNKAKSANDCVVQTGPCAQKESNVDAGVALLCQGSPSGAFLAPAE